MTYLVAASVLAAVVAVVQVVSVRRRLRTLSDSHWELRYEFARLRARVAKLDGGPAAAPDPEDPAAGG
jgi:hypothetical protein